MADTAAFFISTTGGPLVSSVDLLDFTATFAPLVTIADLVPPTATAVTDISKPVSKADPLVVHISDLIVLKGLVVIVKYPNNDWEAAYDGTNFSARYKQAASGSSTLVKTSGTSWTLTLRREGGWPFDPTVCVKAVDGAGNLS